VHDLAQRRVSASRPAQVVGEQAARGEEGHLSVVGDGPDPAVGKGEVAGARRAEPGADRFQGQELHRRAERIARSAAQEATAGPVEGVRSHRK
jgi:hypothetical protein